VKDFNKKTLYTYGCSFTEDVATFYNDLDNNDFRVNYVNNFNDGVCYPPYPKILANKLGYNLINISASGNSNQQILSDFFSNVSKYKEGDVVIIQWSIMYRFRWPTNNGWQRVISTITNEFMNKIISINVCNQILVSRGSELYRNELYDTMKFIDDYASLKKIKIFYWTIDYDLIYEQIKKGLYNKKYLLIDKIIRYKGKRIIDFLDLYGGKNITQETNGVINDVHLGKTGNEVIADLFYDDIKKFI
jgi:hypothetical protein